MTNWSSYSKLFIKLFSLFIAIVLWYYVINLHRKSRSFTTSIEFRNTPSKDFWYTDFNFKKIYPIKVQISGEKEAVDYLQSIKCYVDLGSPKVGEYKYKIKKEIPTLAKLAVELEFNEISITFQKIISKEMQVSPDVKITPAKNFKLLNSDYDPKTIILKGRENEINKIIGVKTKTYNFKNRNENFNKKLDIVYYMTNENGNVKNINLKNMPSDIAEQLKKQKINFSASFVRLKKIEMLNKWDVKVNDVKIINVNIFSSLKIVEKNLTLNYIIYRGPHKFVKQITGNEVAYINIGNITAPGSYEVDVIPQEIKNLKVLDYHPKKIRVTLKQKGSS